MISDSLISLVVWANRAFEAFSTRIQKNETELIIRTVDACFAVETSSRKGFVQHAGAGWNYSTHGHRW